MNDAADAAPERTLCIVLHDVAEATRPACARTLAAVRAVAGDAPVTLLAVPRYHGEVPSADMEAWLGERVQRGDEPALHGYTHRDDGTPRSWLDGLRRSHYTRGEGEFCSLPRAEALARIDAGIEWFAGNGWPLAGFVAPAWLLGEGAWGALAERRFEYTSTLRQLVELPSRRAHVSQSVVYSTSSAWRRGSSLLWNGAVARLERNNQVLRLELHPRDADFTGVLRSWQRILEKALADRRPVTVRDAVRRLRQAGSSAEQRSDVPADAGTHFQTTTTAD